MIAPTLNKINQGKHGPYNAVDYDDLPDPTIYAPEDGVIATYDVSGDCGNRMHLQGEFRHTFCHLEKAYVVVGQQVKKGTALGKMGYSGKTVPIGPAGRHLHWVLFKNGKYYYPPDYVNEKGVTMNSPTQAEVESAFRQYNVNGEDGTPQKPTAKQIQYYTTSPWTRLLDDLLHYVADRERRENSTQTATISAQQARIKELEGQITTKPTQLGKGLYEFK